MALLKPATPIVDFQELTIMYSTMGLGASTRESDLINGLSPPCQTLLAALVTGEVGLKRLTTIPEMANAYNTYRVLIGIQQHEHRDTIRTWVDQLSSYNLLYQQDNSVHGRKRVDPDSVSYRLSNSNLAISILKVITPSSPHRIHLVKYMARINEERVKHGLQPIDL